MTGVSYLYRKEGKKYETFVSVPSRGDWGFLRSRYCYIYSADGFPSPPEVNGVSYKMVLSTQ